jgi:hypothetical protein
MNKERYFVWKNYEELESYVNNFSDFEKLIPNVSSTTGLILGVGQPQLPSGADLNNYTSDQDADTPTMLGKEAEGYRVYRSPDSSTTNSIVNLPADWPGKGTSGAGTFVLETVRHGSTQWMQRITRQAYNGSNATIYIRSYVHSGNTRRWNPWFKVELTQVQTPSTLNMSKGAETTEIKETEDK